MPTAVTTTKIGNSVRFKITLYNDLDQPTDATAITVEVWKGPRNDIQILAATVPTDAGVGVYEYWWNTTGKQPGSHRVIWRATVDGKYVVETRDFTLTEPKV